MMTDFINVNITYKRPNITLNPCIAVSAKKPMTLIRILNEMPVTEKVGIEGEKITVELKSTAPPGA